VADEGIGIGTRRASPGIRHGLSMVGTLAQALEIAPGCDPRGTVVTTAFGPEPPAPAAPGLETLCELAVETVADVSSVTLVQNGVLSRVAAEVAHGAD
jgi:hypothetical protein